MMLILFAMTNQPQIATATVIMTLTTNFSGQGTVNPYCPTGCGYQVNQGVDVEASPSSGWQFSTWSINGASCTSGTASTSCIFQMPNNPVTVTANFIKGTTASTQTLTTTVSGQGSVNPNCQSGCPYTVGQQVTFTASPNSGWQFSSWSGVSCSGGQTSNSCSFSMPNNAVTLEATFTQPFGFSINVSPSLGSVQAGGTATGTVSLTLTSSSSQSVSLSESGLPGNVGRINFGSTSCSPTCQSSFSIGTFSTAPAGSYPITITGTGGGLANSAAYMLTVTSSSPFLFSLSTSSNSLSVTQGNSVSAAVTVSLTSGSTQTVSLSVSGLPSGATPSFNPSSCSPTCTSTLTITTSNTPAGTYFVTVTGTAGIQTATATISLSVTPSTSPLVVSISPSSATTQVGQPVQFFATSSGGSGGYTYVWHWQQFNTVNQGSQNTGSSNTYAFTPSSSGTFGVYVIATDSSGGSAQSLETTVAVPSSAPPPTPTGNLQVQVYSQSTGNPIAGATVAMTSTPSGQSPLTGSTDSSGQYTFQTVLAGSYTVSVTAQGYQSGSGSATVSAGQTGAGTVTLASSSQTATVAFSTTGLGASASGAVLTVDGTTYSVSQLPMQFTWNVSSTHSFSWYSTVTGGSTTEYVWETSSGLATQQSGTIAVPSGGGSVTASYSPSYQVTFLVSPSGAGTVTPSGGGSAPGSITTSESAWYSSGTTISVGAQPSSGNTFQSWSSSTPAISISNPTSTSTSASINGPGTITANFPGTVSTSSLVVSISPGSATIQVSRSVQFTASASGGSGGYTYVWYWEQFNTVNRGSQNTGSSSAYAFTPTGSGSFEVYVVMTDSSGNSAQSLYSTVTITNSTPPSTATGNFQVQVYSQSTGNPIGAATVTMTNAPSGQNLLTGSTDSSGQYTFQNVLAGSYAVSVSAQGYQTGSGSGTVSGSQTGETTIKLTVTAPAPGCPPTLSLFTPQVSGLTVSVNGVTSPCTPSASIARIHWDWGDGMQQDSWFQATHSYSQRGTYTVSVTSFQSDGLSTTMTTSVTVGPSTTPTQTLTTGVGSGSGSVNPNCPSGCSETVGSSVTVTANPSSGWQFSSWSIQTGIGCGSANPCSFSMPNNPVTLAATFTQTTSFAFSISTPSDESTSQGDSATFSFTVTTTSGSPLPIDLSLVSAITNSENLGTYLSWSQNPVTPSIIGSTVQLIVQVPCGAPLGGGGYDDPMKITGSAGGASISSGIFDLAVKGVSSCPLLTLNVLSWSLNYGSTVLGASNCPASAFTYSGIPPDYCVIPDTFAYVGEQFSVDLTVQNVGTATANLPSSLVTLESPAGYNCVQIPVGSTIVNSSLCPKGKEPLYFSSSPEVNPVSDAGGNSLANNIRCDLSPGSSSSVAPGQVRSQVVYACQVYAWQYANADIGSLKNNLIEAESEALLEGVVSEGFLGGGLRGFVASGLMTTIDEGAFAYLENSNMFIVGVQFTIGSPAFAKYSTPIVILASAPPTKVAEVNNVISEHIGGAVLCDIVSSATGIGVEAIAPGGGVVAAVIVDVECTALVTSVGYLSEAVVAFDLQSSTASSVTAVAANPSTGTVGNAIVFTVTTTPATGSGPPPTGTVSWLAGSIFSGFLGSCTLVSGSCTITYTPTSAGTVLVIASYGGDSSYSGSAGTFTLSVSTTSQNLPAVASSGCPPALVLFTPQLSGMTVSLNGVTNPCTLGASIVRIHWDWGDGMQQDSWFPAAHTYSQGGAFTISVTSLQSDGLTRTETSSVSVWLASISPPATTTTSTTSSSVAATSVATATTQTSSSTLTTATTASLTTATTINNSASGSALTCTYIVSPSSGAAPLTGQFSVSCSGGSQPYSYHWSFGDGSTSALQSSTHTYSSSGVYPWSIFVIDAAGNVYSVAGTISIQ